MSFLKLETKHYLLIIFGIVVLFLLDGYSKNRENYSPIQTFPFYPPKYWNPIKQTYWAPFVYNENAYDTVIPKITREIYNN